MAAPTAKPSDLREILKKVAAHRRRTSARVRTLGVPGYASLREIGWILYAQGRTARMAEAAVVACGVDDVLYALVDEAWHGIGIEGEVWLRG
jgi:ribosomal protein L27